MADKKSRKPPPLNVNHVQQSGETQSVTSRMILSRDDRLHGASRLERRMQAAGSQLLQRKDSDRRSNAAPSEYGSVKEAQSRPHNTLPREERERDYSDVVTEDKAQFLIRYKEYRTIGASNRAIYKRQCHKLRITPKQETLNALPDRSFEFTMRVLDLRDHHLTSIRPVFDLLRLNTNLEAIYLQGNDFPNIDLVVLCDILKACTNLTTLDLSDNPSIIWAPSILKYIHILARSLPNLEDITIHKPLPIDIPEGGPSVEKSAQGENIIIFVDQHRQMNLETFKKPLPRGTDPASPRMSTAAPLRLTVVQKAINSFMRSKHLIDEDHGFCVCGIKEQGVDFALYEPSFEASLTTLIRRVDAIQIMKEGPRKTGGSHNTEHTPNGKQLFKKRGNDAEVAPDTKATKTLDMMSILELCENKIEECREEGPNKRNFRAIVFWGRNDGIPVLNRSATSKRLFSNPLFTIDLVFLHGHDGSQTLSPSSLPAQEVFDAIIDVAKLCPNGSYAYECNMFGSDYAEKLHKVTGNLLYHPMQRPFKQRNLNCSLFISEDEAINYHEYLTLRDHPLGPYGRFPMTSARSLELAPTPSTGRHQSPAVVSACSRASSHRSDADFLEEDYSELPVEQVLATTHDEHAELVPWKAILKEKLFVPCDTRHVKPIFVCGECKDVLRDPQQAACGHYLCQQCLDKKAQYDSCECPTCGVEIDMAKLCEPEASFFNYLGNINVICPYGCATRLKADQRDAHNKKCVRMKILCAGQDCRWVGTRKEYVEHYFSCPHRMVICNYCGVTTSFKTARVHTLTCKCVEDTCERCHESVARKDLHRHHAMGCELKEVKCLYAALGCEYRGPPAELKFHLAEDCVPMTIISGVEALNEKLTLLLTRRKAQGENSHFEESLSQMTNDGFNSYYPTDVMVANFRRFVARRATCQAMIEIFGCPVEYDPYWNWIAFFFANDPKKPCLAITRFPGRFPDVPPIIHLTNTRADIAEKGSQGHEILDLKTHGDATLLASELRARLIVERTNLA